ncbi:MAG: thiamine pyrophosphate-binding protein [Betaproteobacteria bacterium]
MKKFRGADALAQSLHRAGVKHIFALSGNHIMPLFDALFDTGIELIHTRHEAACVHMADAYARLTGKPGIALVTGGPGHANAVGALYTAQMSEAPVVLLSGHAPNDQLGMGSFQEMRQAEMAAPVTKASWAAASADSLSGDLARAMREAASGRPGPVHLSLPTDVLENVATQGAQPDARAFGSVPMPLRAADAQTVMAWLDAAKRPVILTGPASLTPSCRVRLKVLEDVTGIPVVGMESPRGVNDPALGAFAEMLARADRVLLVGKKVDFTLKFGQAFDVACELMQIDAEEIEIARARKAFGTRLKLSAQTDALSSVDGLIASAGAHAKTVNANTGTWRDEVRAAIDHRPSAWDTAKSALTDRLHPVEACRPLQSVLDSHPNAVLVSDGGEFGQWAQACLTAPQRVINGPAGAIGAALPFALGARAAHPMKSGVPIIALMGDGTFGFHSAEFDTAVRHKLPFVLIVGNDARWNAEYQIQLKAYGKERLFGCELLPVRYDQVAIAFGGHGELVTQASQLLPAVTRAIASGLPACVNVMIEGVPAPVVKRP